MAHQHSHPGVSSFSIHGVEESEMEATHRQQADFPKVENDLKFSTFSYFEAGIVDQATGLLGSKNPFGKKANVDENEVWLLDNTAYKPIHGSTSQSEWEAEFVACFFRKGRKDITEHVAKIADALGLDGKAGENEATRQLIAERLQPFVTAIAPARSINITIPNNTGPSTKLTLGPSNNNGISSQNFPTGSNDSADGTTVTYANDGSEFPPCEGWTRFAGPNGWAIVSDIDDTIKVTQTSDPIGILQTTFAEEPKTTEGMPDFYKALNEQFANPAWFYLSASPYNLYPFLHKFLHQNYPPGTIILRDTSWMFFGGLLQSFTQGVQAYKSDRLEKVHRWLPQRKFVCIGDSTQRDPETYAAMYKKYPGWIKAIYIRKVLDVPFIDFKNREERFTDAFKDVPSDVWRVFVTPNEVVEHMKWVSENDK